MSTSQEEVLIARAKEITKIQGKSWDSRLERLLRFGARNLIVLPTKRRTGKIESIADIDPSYLKAYIGRYYREREGAVVLKPVSTKPDPAVNAVLIAYERVLPESLDAVEEAHRLSMQAENVIGKLLERYVATLLERKGWIWCCGETMRSIDFVKDAEGQDPQLLQIKNRDNSENSSSAAIRVGTSIKKWYRINSVTGKTRWDSLPENEDDCSEEGFYRFVANEAKRRPLIEEIPADESAGLEQ